MGAGMHGSAHAWERALALNTWPGAVLRAPNCRIVPNEGYSEEHFDTYVERWAALAALIVQGFQVSSKWR
jgi:hypothetical protein